MNIYWGAEQKIQDLNESSKNLTSCRVEVRNTMPVIKQSNYLWLKSSRS